MIQFYPLIIQQLSATMCYKALPMNYNPKHLASAVSIVETKLKQQSLAIELRVLETQLGANV